MALVLSLLTPNDSQDLGELDPSEAPTALVSLEMDLFVIALQEPQVENDLPDGFLLLVKNLLFESSL